MRHHLKLVDASRRAMLHARAAAAVVGIIGFGLTNAAAPAAAEHPLDTLSAAEITQAVSVLREAGHADERARYPLINLFEPTKQDVLDWTPGQPFLRRAQLVAKVGTDTYEAVVNLTEARVESWARVPGVQPSILGEEWAAAQDLVRADPSWQRSMRARGYVTFDSVFCDSYSAGYFGPAPGAERRLLKMPCYDISEGGNNLYARPIEGLYTVVDLDQRAVVEVIDTGPVAVSRSPNLLEAATQPLAVQSGTSDAKPASFTFEGGRVSWGNWSFHLRFDRRVGPILSLITHEDVGRKRSIMYRASVSEMFVPYMDPDVGWSYRTFMDAGEYGLGRLASPLVASTDCPADASYIDAIQPSEKGTPYLAPRIMCVFERATGAPLWRHAETLNSTYVGRSATELVVRTIPTVGNYDYLIDWVFTQTGGIRVDVGATGYPAVKGVKDQTAPVPTLPTQTSYGTLIAPNLLAVHHDHYISFRFDLDVDGLQNSFVRGRLTATQLPADNRRRSLWTVREVPTPTETGISATHAPEIWRVINPHIRTELGHSPGIEIVGSHPATSLLHPEDWPQRRASFSAEQLWVTRYKPEELYAAGPYPNQSQGGAGVSAYADGESISDADIVAWYTMGFHHVPRVEDWPIQPTSWHSVMLRPSGFFSRNPSTPATAR